MKKKYTTYIKLDESPIIYETNPSVIKTSSRLTTKKQKTIFKNNNSALVDASTGELAGQLQRVFIQEVEVDTERFIKVYADSLEELMDLSASGLKVFKLIYSEMLNNYGQDFIYLDFNELVHFKKWKFTQNTFMSGVNDLLRRGVIYKSVGTNKYFINIELFFNGDRVAVIKQYRLKQADMFDEQDLLN